MEVSMAKYGAFRLGTSCAGIGLLLVSLVVAGQVASGSGKPGFSPNLLRQGKRLYERRCVFCHGSRGKGDGPISRAIFPKPRDFVRGIFKIRSTPSGRPPTDLDLFETISRGMPGTMMPSFSNLREDQQWALVYYIKSFFTEPDAPSPEPFKILDKEPIPSKNSHPLRGG